MGLIYTASFSSVAVSAIQDLFQLVAPADAIVIVHSAEIGQESDAGNAEAELLPIQISRTDLTVNGSGGTAPTPRPHEVGMPAAGTVVEVNNTTQSTVTTVVHSSAWNVQAGWFYVPTPETRIVISPSGGLVVELPVAPADEITVSGSITFEEVGG